MPGTAGRWGPVHRQAVPRRRRPGTARVIAPGTRSAGVFRRTTTLVSRTPGSPQQVSRTAPGGTRRRTRRRLGPRTPSPAADRRPAAPLGGCAGRWQRSRRRAGVEAQPSVSPPFLPNTLCSKLITDSHHTWKPRARCLAVVRHAGVHAVGTVRTHPCGRAVVSPVNPFGGRWTVVGTAEPASFNHPLALVRHLHGWSYQGLVDAIARQAARMPHVGNMAARREKAWRWEHWGVVPDRDTQLALAALLNLPADRIDLLGWPRWLPVGDLIRADLPWTATGCRTALAEALEGAMLDRRGFLVLSGGMLTGLADQWLSVEEGKVAAALDGRTRVDGELVGWIEHRIPMLRRMDDQIGGTQLRQVVDAELRLVSSLLDEGKHTSLVGNRLCAAAAELGQLAGWVSFDAGLHAAAQRYYVAALHAAQAGACRLALKRYDAAQVQLCEALRLQDPSYTRDRTIYHVRLASTQLALGHVEHACALATDALELARRGSSQR